MKIILASQSKARKELLKQMGYKFDVLVSNADETLEEGLSLEEQSQKIAYIKAKTVFDETSGDRLVIGADTMVIKNGVLYGKPKNKEEVIKMFHMLRNTDHKIITSVCVLVEQNGKYIEHIDYDVAKVFFKYITDEEILYWLKVGNPYIYAGGYALESPFGVFAKKIEGNFTTIEGLPTHKLYDILKQYVEREA